ncbi:MAG: hypothetical protein ACXVIL_11205, partial [Halobacteriota archaeon]
IVPYDDGGSFRRIKVNPFVNVPSVIDKDLKQHFMEFPEAQERILAWLVEGCLLWQREGLDDVPIEVERANAEYRRNQNVLSSFIEDYCVLDRHAGKGTEGTLAREMVEAFNYYKGQYGLDELSTKSFGKYMAALGYKGYTDGKRRGYLGIRLKTDREIVNDVGFYDLERQYDGAEEQYALAARRVVVRCACVHDLALTFDIYFALLITNNILSSLQEAGVGTRVGTEGTESVYDLCQNGTINVKRQQYLGPRDSRSRTQSGELLSEKSAQTHERLQDLVRDAVSDIVREYRGTYLRPDLIPSLVANHVKRQDDSFTRDDIITCLQSQTPKEPVASAIAELTDGQVTGDREANLQSKDRIGGDT